MNRQTKLQNIKLEKSGERITLSPTLEQVAQTNQAKQRLIVARELLTICKEQGYDIPQGDVLIAIAAMVVRYFPKFMIQDIPDAFDQFATGIIQVDVKFAKTITKQLVGRVLREYNSKVVQHRPAHQSDEQAMEHPPMSETARRAKSDQIIASKVDHLINIRQKLQKGGHVYLMINDFNFLIKCGVKFTQEEKEAAITRAKEMVKAEIDRDRDDRKITVGQYDSLLKSLETRQYKSNSPVELEAKRLLLRSWLMKSTYDQQSMYNLFKENYSYACAI